jgi:tetratricopeptide (TPR) repeat protein
MAIDLNDSDAMYNIGYCYEKLGDYENMKTYYNLAIANNNELAMDDIVRIEKAILDIPVDNVM